MKNITFPFLAMLSFGLAACEDEVSEEVLDMTAPTILLTSPISGSEFYPTQYVPVKATVTDETFLEEVVISFTGPEDLNNSYTRRNGEEGITFSENKVDQLDFTFPLASGFSPGTYTLTLHASDKQGNQAIEQSVTVIILEEDLEKPVISIEEPEASTSYFLEDTLAVSGVVTDNIALKAIRISLSRSGGETIYNREINNFENGNNYSIAEQFPIPADADLGEYILTVEGEDKRGNFQSYTVALVIEEPTQEE